MMIKNISKIKELQEIVDREFNKILKVNIDNKLFNIAIRKDQIPQIQEFKILDNSMWISFVKLNSPVYKAKEHYMIKNKDGEIIGLLINQLSKLKSKDYRFKVNRMMLNEIKEFPENDTNEILMKHKQKRIAHALSEIINIVPTQDHTK